MQNFHQKVIKKLDLEESALKKSRFYICVQWQLTWIVKIFNN